MGEILLGVITKPDNTRYFIASSTYIGDVEPIGGGTAVPTVFYGDIPDDKPIAWRKEMGFFVWGRRSMHEIGETWLMNEPAFAETSGRYDGLLYDSRDSKLEYFIVEDENQAFSTAVRVGEWIIDDVSNPNDQYVVITVVDKLSQVDKNTEHEYYSNTLVFTENREQPRPIVIGRCNQMPLTLIDDVDNIYEAHFEGTVSNFIDAYDTADIFVPGVDYTEGVQSTGGYGINLANKPAGVITAHVSGGEWMGGSTRIIDNFVPYLLVTCGGMDIADINTASLTAIDTDWSNRYDVFIQSGSNIRDVLEDVMVGHCGYVYQNNDGEVTFGYVQQPKVTADHELNDINIASDGIKITLDKAPGLSDAVSWRRNWYVFTYDDVKDVGITEAEKQEASREYVYNYRSATTTGGGDAFHDTYAHARHGDHIKTLTDGGNNGTDLISHLEDDLYDVERHFHTFERISETVIEALTIELGETMELVDARFFPSGKNTLISAIAGESLLSKKVEFETWG